MESKDKEPEWVAVKNSKRKKYFTNKRHIETPEPNEVPVQKSIFSWADDEEEMNFTNSNN